MHKCHRRRFFSRPSAWYGTVAVLCGIVIPASSAIGQPADTPPFYACREQSETTSTVAGIELCTAEPTDALTNRAVGDNLQVRAGALVTNIDSSSIAASAGLARGDVIYRIGGNNIEDSLTAADQLSKIGTSADTIVNFLRSGRPYRVKLRR